MPEAGSYDAGPFYLGIERSRGAGSKEIKGVKHETLFTGDARLTDRLE